MVIKVFFLSLQLIWMHRLVNILFYKGKTSFMTNGILMLHLLLRKMIRLYTCYILFITIYQYMFLNLIYIDQFRWSDRRKISLSLFRIKVEKQFSQIERGDNITACFVVLRIHYIVITNIRNVLREFSDRFEKASHVSNYHYSVADLICDHFVQF